MNPKQGFERTIGTVLLSLAASHGKRSESW